MSIFDRFSLDSQGETRRCSVATNRSSGTKGKGHRWAGVARLRRPVPSDESDRAVGSVGSDSGGRCPRLTLPHYHSPESCLPSRKPQHARAQHATPEVLRTAFHPVLGVRLWLRPTAALGLPWTAIPGQMRRSGGKCCLRAGAVPSAPWIPPGGTRRRPTGHRLLSTAPRSPTCRRGTSGWPPSRRSAGCGRRRASRPRRRREPGPARRRRRGR